MYWRQVVSQSPLTSVDSEAIVKYKQGWRALNRLLHEDKSFSGHEKNCAFLNMGDGQFASVSSVTGLDFDDDSRAIAICDWDFDGRLDFWMTGRTAPRLRLVRNLETTAGAFVAFKLQGTGARTNRDAIGARVEVVLKNGDPSKRLVKTIHAGDAFLSQSSGWLHFGLGAHADIAHVIIDWPVRDDQSKRRQTISGIRPNGFYLVQQGKHVAEAWQPPKSRIAMEPAVQIPAPEATPIRIVLPSRLPLPEIHATSNSEVESENIPLTGPLLVNVWSATCPVCVRELTEWAAEADQFKLHGLALLAINADAGNGDVQADAVMEKIGASIPLAVATPASILAIDYFQRAMLDRWQPLPVPCSFLLDKHGQVVVIYKGAIDSEQLWEDLALLDLNPEQVREAGAPFDGQWLRSVPGGDPTAVSKQMIDHRSVNMAISYLGKFIDANQDASSSRLADTHYIRGVLLESQKRFPEAIASIRQSAKLKPDDVRAHSELARLLENSGKLAEAQTAWMAAYKINRDNYEVQHGLAMNLLRQKNFKASVSLLSRMLSKRPDDAIAHFRLATAYRNLKKWPEAKASYSRVLELRPDMILAANNLAWMLATNPDPALRDGARAVALAERACSATAFKAPDLLDTLSVAYAENGQFRKAAEAARRAVKILQANSRNTSETVQPIIDRIKDFEANRPFRDEG